MGGGHKDEAPAAPAVATGLHVANPIKYSSPLLVNLEKGLFMGGLFGVGTSLGACAFSGCCRGCARVRGDGTGRAQGFPCSARPVAAVAPCVAPKFRVKP